ITKVVNMLTAQSEIGSPMASMYLLKHPDHYTDHLFRRFYWKGYINENIRGIVGFSPLADYMYRPDKYGDVSLYDWVRLSHKQMKVTHWKSLPDNTSSSQSKDEPVEINEDDSDSDTISVTSEESEGENIDTESNESESSDSEEEAVEDNIHGPDDSDTVNKKKADPYYLLSTFKEDHPQCETHRVRMKKEENALVPDFVGGILPRRDKGNREDYCMTMFTLFQPWRTGLELKDTTATWSETFDSYKFTSRQTDIMNHFNLRYECNDARDDYAAQRKSKNTTNETWPFELDDTTLDRLEEDYDN
ncbi:hypothetical protein BDW22DRAFT_1300189, partial [Trametopsis cervina]